jgi:hypothetical protein
MLYNDSHECNGGPLVVFLMQKTKVVAACQHVTFVKSVGIRALSRETRWKRRVISLLFGPRFFALPSHLQPSCNIPLVAFVLDSTNKHEGTSQLGLTACTRQQTFLRSTNEDQHTKIHG